MISGHSFLVYAPTFCPLDHWQRVLPDAQLCENGKDLPVPCEGNLLWVSSDLPGWQELTQSWTSSGSRVVILAREPGPVEMNRALASGARAYVSALANKNVLQQVAESVGSGGLWFPEDLLGNLLKLVANVLDQTAKPRIEANLSILTAREKEVARQASKGVTNRQIAEALGITERTVKEHMGSVFRKLGVRDRMQLMLLVTGQRVEGGSDDVHQA
jgi:DNA-binding NarL/FixJ family response regulator